MRCTLFQHLSVGNFAGHIGTNASFSAELPIFLVTVIGGVLLAVGQSTSKVRVSPCEAIFRKEGEVAFPVSRAAVEG